MNILTLSKDDSSISLANRLAYEGHKVYSYISDPLFAFSGMGIVDKVNSWRPLLPSLDLVVVTSDGFAHHKPIFTQYGIPTIGCTPNFDPYIDSTIKFDLLKKTDINRPVFVIVDPDTDVIPVINSWADFGYIVKIPELSREYKINNPDELVWVFNSYKNNIKVFQETPKGEPVNILTMFNGRQFISPYIVSDSISFTRRIMDNDTISTELLEPLTQVLQELRHRGFLQIKASINEGNIQLLDFSPFIDHTMVSILLESIRDPLADVLFDLAQGILKRTLMTHDVIVTSNLYHSDGISSRPLNIPDLALPHIHLVNVMKQVNQYLTTKSSGLFASVSARGTDSSFARSRLTRTINSINFSGMTFDKDYLLHKEQTEFINRIQNG